MITLKPLIQIPLKILIANNNGSSLAIRKLDNYVIPKLDEVTREIKIIKKVLFENEMKMKKGVIYFIQGIETKLIKPGYSSKEDWITDRILKQLYPSSPDGFDILFAFEGTMHQENLLHKQFDIFMDHNEWFEPVPEIFRVIELLKESSKIKKVEIKHKRIDKYFIGVYNV